MATIYKKFIYAVLSFIIIAFPISSLPLHAETLDEFATGPLGETGPTSTPGPIGETGVLSQDDMIDSKIVETNLQTGANSNNQNRASESRTNQVGNIDNSQSQNEVDLKLISGENRLTGNSNVGNIVSGNIDGGINIVNLDGAVLSPQSSVGLSTIDEITGDVIIPESLSTKRATIPTSANQNNSITGNSSRNSNMVDKSNSLLFTNLNSQKNSNNINIVADSGSNVIAQNTTIGDLISGSINLGLNLIDLSQIFNPNFVLDLDILTIKDNINGDLILPKNTQTGANSLNNSVSDQSKSITIDNLDTSSTNSVFDFSSNTGQNEIDKNTSIENISTGNTNISATSLNLSGETGVIYIVNLVGKLFGDLISLPENVIVQENTAQTVNAITGANSINQNQVEAKNNISSLNEDKSSTENKIRINANTGKNQVIENTAINDFKTGNINILANTVTLKNATELAGQLKLKIINVLGNLFGNIRSSSPDENENQQPINSPVENRQTMINTETTTTTSTRNSREVSSSKTTLSSSNIQNSENFTSTSDQDPSTAINNISAPSQNNPSRLPQHSDFIFPTLASALWMAMEAAFLLLRKIGLVK